MQSENCQVVGTGLVEFAKSRLGGVPVLSIRGQPQGLSLRLSGSLRNPTYCFIFTFREKSASIRTMPAPTKKVLW